jgi:methyl-accepting chemotaxis protein
MKIGWRISTTFAVVLSGFLFISTTVYRNTRELIATNEWVVHTQLVLERLQTVVRSANRAEASILGFVGSSDPSRLSDLDAAKTRMKDAAQQVQALTRDNPEQQRQLVALLAHLASYTTTLDSIVRAVKPAAAHTAVDYQDGLSQIRAIISAIEDEERRLLAERTRLADATATHSLRLIVWGGACTMLVCIVAGVFLALAIVRPVRRLLLGATEFGAGHLQYRIERSSSDELGQLAEAFNVMAMSLSRTMVTATTETDARTQIEALLHTIAETAARLSSATAEIATATKQQASGAQEQVAAITQTVVSVNEVVQSAQAARDRALRVAVIAAESVEHGRQGRQVVQDSLRAMAEIRGLVERSATSTAELAQQTRAIGTIIDSVSDIAEQTNILALNAAIEANHAGERGRTFRVVAQHVKALAAESKDASLRVRAILQDVQKATERSMQVAEECSLGVAKASSVIARADENILALARVIDSASEAASHIASSANEQAAGTDQIHRSIQLINALTVQNLSSTRQTEHAAQELHILGSQLRDGLGNAGQAA